MITFDRVIKRYGNNEVLHSISLSLPQGEIISIIGRSGCGKTTLLKTINRLIPLTSGKILINGQDIQSMNPVTLRRQIGYVIQQTGLFPHMTIYENLATVLQLHHVSKIEYEPQIQKIVDKVGLSRNLLPRYPAELSGGQQQRVGVARALITNPEIILMDEPFSALDPITRLSLQDEILHLQTMLHKTIVFVTHDMDEAIKISDHICLMRDGHVEAFATPEMILRQPSTPYVANFIGKHRIWNSPEFIKAEDIMISATNLCYPQDTLLRCMNKIQNIAQDYLIVVASDTKVFCGLINVRLIRKQKNLNLTAADIMQQPVATAGMKDSLPQILMTVKKLRRPYMVVLDDQRCFQGLITQSSLVAALGRQYVDETEAI